MSTHADHTQEDKQTARAAGSSKIQNAGETTFQLSDKRPEAGRYGKTREMANNSPRVQQQKTVQAMADTFTYQFALLNRGAEKETLQGKFQTVQKKENQTGLPDNLKSGIENLSGHSMNDVKVHYNSSQPAQLNAHAYAQGTDIHVAPGQEKHLPHEAWHVVQQKQGRVKPTMQLKGGIPVNDNQGLEKEADTMGAKAQLKQRSEPVAKMTGPQATSYSVVQNKTIQKSSIPPLVNFTVDTPANLNGMVAQMKWIDDGGKVLVWDQLMDGVQWYFVKETEEMFYRIANAKAIQLGDLQSYQVYEGQEKPYGFWQQNSVLDLDIGRYLDPSVIRPNQVVEKELAPKTGMDALDKDDYLHEVKAVETGWGDKEYEDRAVAVLEAVNKYLANAGVPTLLTYEIEELDGDSHGAFNEVEWGMRLNQKNFEKGSISTESMAEIADTVFHEARHAEQFFRIARLLAGFGLQLGEIQSKMTTEGRVMNGTIIGQAINKPMVIDGDGLSTEVLETLNWYQSIYGGKSKLRVDTILLLKQTKLQFYEAKLALEKLKEDHIFVVTDFKSSQMQRGFELDDVRAIYNPLLKKLEKLGNIETDEVANLKLEKTRLEQVSKDIIEKYAPTLKELQNKGAHMKEQMLVLHKQMEIAMIEVDKLQHLYENLPEEVDAWRIGGGIQSAYKLLI